MTQQPVLLPLVLQEEVTVLNKLAMSREEEQEVIGGMAIKSMKFAEKNN